MAKQSQKSEDKNTEILHVVAKYTQILRSRRKIVEMLFNKKVFICTADTGEFEEFMHNKTNKVHYV